MKNTQVAFYSTTLGMTEKFVRKLNDVDLVRIPKSLDQETPLVTAGSFVAIPTYHDGDGPAPVILPCIERFLQENRENLVGIIGIGNRNFGHSFCLSAKVASSRYNIPIAGLVELMGTPEEVAMIQEAIEFTRR